MSMRKFLLRVEELENASAVAVADLDENQITSVVSERTADPVEDLWSALLEAAAMIHQKITPSLVVLPDIQEAVIENAGTISEPDSTTESSTEDSS